MTNRSAQFWRRTTWGLVALNIFIWSGNIALATIYPAGSLLQPNDVTSLHIRQGTIQGEDVNTSTPLRVKSASTTDFTTSTLTATSSATLASTTSYTLNVGALTSTSSASFQAASFAQFPTLPAGNPTNATDAASKSYADSAGGKLTYTAVAGMTLDTLTPAFVATTTSTAKKEQQYEGGNTGQVCRNDANGLDTAQEFKTGLPMLVTTLVTSMGEVGTPTQSMTFGIQSDNAGLPSGTWLAQTTVTAADVPAVTGTTTATLAEPILLIPETVYHFVIACNASNATNYYTIPRSGNNNYPRGGAEYYQSGVWNELAGYDLFFEVNDDTLLVDRVYQANAVNMMLASTTIGFIQTRVTKGQTGTIQIGGTLSGFTGFATGNGRWLSNTGTTTSANTGTIGKLLGRAVASTTLLINPDLVNW